MKYYAETHEWIEKVGNVYRVGISKHAQSELNNIVYVEPIDEGLEVKKGERLGSIESVKATEDIFAPVDLKVIRFNEVLDSKPEIIDKSPEDEGWIVEVEILDENQLQNLMNEEEYKKFIG